MLIYLLTAIAQVATEPAQDLTGLLVSIGTGGTLVSGLVTTIALILRWQSRQVQRGLLVPKTTVDELLKAAGEKFAAMVESYEKQLAAQTARGDEWREAHELSEAGRAEERSTTAKAVESNRTSDRLWNYVVQQVPTLGTPHQASDSPSGAVTTS